MKITIKYESSWRNSFLDGDNNEPLPKKGRNFIASMTELKKDGNYLPRKPEKSTIMGILNRLIGDQRKLHQSRGGENYYFLDIESQISFIDEPEFINTEMAYIRNMKGSTDQNSFTGMIKANDPAFHSDYSQALWGTLWLDFNDLCQFILNDGYQINTAPDIDPVAVITHLEVLDKEKPVEVTALVQETLERLAVTFEGQDYLNPKGLVKPVMFYCAALYIQLDRLQNNFDLGTVTTASGGISGISKRGFTKKDFMSRYTTGKKKIIWGNPYLKKERIKGVGEVTSMLKKASGTLSIKLDVDSSRAKELRELIDSAGVSSFYLGKKGLAYVSDIRL